MDAVARYQEMLQQLQQHMGRQGMVMPVTEGPPIDIGRRMSYFAEARPLETKVHAALAEVCRQLPVRLASRISVIRFGPQGVIDPMFEVEFKGGKVISFDNVDEFPTAADVARIALECP